MSGVHVELIGDLVQGVAFFYFVLLIRHISIAYGVGVYTGALLYVKRCLIVVDSSVV